MALVSQSGNVAVNALSSRRGLRFHTVIASGNQAVLSAADYLSSWPLRRGCGRSRSISRTTAAPGCATRWRRAPRRRAVSVLKVGSSATGARAAAAHSGALAGDQRVFRSLVAEAGAVWADDVHDLLELAKTQAGRRRGAGRRLCRRAGLAIMTCSGGDSAQGADEAALLGLELPELSPATRERLAALLPSAATAANPLDYTSMVWGDVVALSELIRSLGEDPAIGLVLVFYDQPAGCWEPWRSRGAMCARALGGARRSARCRRSCPRRCPSCSTTAPRPSWPPPAFRPPRGCARACGVRAALLAPGDGRLRPAAGDRRRGPGA